MLQPLFKGENLGWENKTGPRGTQETAPQRDPGDSTHLLPPLVIFLRFCSLFLRSLPTSHRFLSSVVQEIRVMKDVAMGAHSCNSSSGEAEAGGLLVQGQGWTIEKDPVEKEDF